MRYRPKQAKATGATARWLIVGVCGVVFVAFAVLLMRLFAQPRAKPLAAADSAQQQPGAVPSAPAADQPGGLPSGFHYMTTEEGAEIARRIDEEKRAQEQEVQQEQDRQQREMERVAAAQRAARARAAKEWSAQQRAAGARAARQRLDGLERRQRSAEDRDAALAKAAVAYERYEYFRARYDSIPYDPSHPSMERNAYWDAMENAYSDYRQALRKARGQ